MIRISESDLHHEFPCVGFFLLDICSWHNSNLVHTLQRPYCRPKQKYKLLHNALPLVATGLGESGKGV